MVDYSKSAGKSGKQRSRTVEEMLIEKDVLNLNRKLFNSLEAEGKEFHDLGQK